MLYENVQYAVNAMHYTIHNDSTDILLKFKDHLALIIVAN